jgi:hypothetical protein
MNKSSCNDTHFTFLPFFAVYLTLMFLGINVLAVSYLPISQKDFVRYNPRPPNTLNLSWVRSRRQGMVNALHL